MGDVIVSMEHITKEFPGVKALDDVKFNLRSGEVMAKETTQNDILKYATSFENKLGSQSQNNKEE